MATVDDVARQTIAAVATDANHLLASRWVVDRLRQVLGKTQFRSLRTVGELSVPAPVNAGTVTATRGSKVVTGNAAAQAVWSVLLAGWFIRVSTVWYEIEGFSGGELKLRSPFAEDTATAHTYHIIQRFMPVDPTARWLGNVMWNQRRRVPIERCQLDELNMQSPERAYQPGDSSRWWCLVGDRIDANGKLCKGIELYPYSSTSEMYNYVFWPVSLELNLNDQLPPEIDPHVLSEGALCDVMRYEMAKALREGKPDVAATWRNEYRAQETKWASIMLDAFRADSATDDLAFIMETGRGSVQVGDIRTAHDIVWQRWKSG